MRFSAALAGLGLAFSPAAPAVPAAPGAVVFLPSAIGAPLPRPAPSSGAAGLARGWGGVGFLALLAVAQHLPVRQVRRPTAGGRSAPILAQEADAGAVGAPAAYIEFIIGVPEPCVPDVSLTRARDGSTGVATFTFDNPTFLQASTEALGETTGMYLKDNEGTLKSTEVTATFTNGKPRIVKGQVFLKGNDEWDRFMRWMERYAEANGLGFNKA